jgi:hypothetical protein
MIRGVLRVIQGEVGEGGSLGEGLGGARCWVRDGVVMF